MGLLLLFVYGRGYITIGTVEDDPNQHLWLCFEQRTEVVVLVEMAEKSDFAELPLLDKLLLGLRNEQRCEDCVQVWMLAEEYGRELRGVNNFNELLQLVVMIFCGRVGDTFLHGN